MPAISLIQLSLHQYWRELKNTDLRLFLISLFLVMTSVTTIQIFTSRVNLALVRQGSHFIAADQMIRQPVAIPDEWHDKAKEIGLESSGYALFTSMLVNGEELALSGVKALQKGYPLRGEIKVANAKQGEERVANSIPKPGTIWLDPALAERISASLGEKVSLGSTDLTFTDYIRYEPDRNATFFGFLPRAMVNHDDLEKAGVLLQGSRVTNAFLYAGDNDSVTQMFDWLEEEKHENARTLDPRDDRRGIGVTLARAEDFLVLSGLLITLLCGIGIALAAQRYTQLRSRHMAIYKTLGMTRAQIIFLVAVQLAGILIFAWLASNIIGWLLQHFLSELAFSLFKIRLPDNFSWVTFLDSFFTGLIAVAAFALPDFIRLSKIPAMHILRASNNSFKSKLSFLPGVLGMLLLALLYSNSLLLSTALFGGIIICWALTALVTRFIIVSGSQNDSFWSLQLARMRKRKMHYSLQTVVFSLCIVFGLMLLLVRTSLIENWREQTPEDAINKMMVNIGAEQKQPILEMMAAGNINPETFYPIVRGRFVKLNDVDSEKVAEESGTKENEHRRELSLTFLEKLPQGNEIVEGQWWPKATKKDTEIARISVEKTVTDNYNIKLNDIMTFRIGASELSAQVTSIRDVDWGEFSPNFYVIFEPGWLDKYPYTYMTGAYISQEKESILNQIIKSHGNVSVFAADVLLARIRNLVDQVSKAIEAILAILIVAGIIVVITGVRSTLDERLHECTLMRTFGASQKDILFMVITEFAILGLISGVLGSAAAETLSWYMHQRIFDLDYIWNPYIWIYGPVAGVLLIGISGTLSCIPSVRKPPIVLLRSILN